MSRRQLVCIFEIEDTVSRKAAFRFVIPISMSAYHRVPLDSLRAFGAGKERRTKRRSCSGKRCIIVSQHCCLADEQMSFTRRRFISHCAPICRTHRAGNGPTRWIRTHIRYRGREKSPSSFFSLFLFSFVRSNKSIWWKTISQWFSSKPVLYGI